MYSNNHFCPYCLKTNKHNYVCGNCQQPTIYIGHRIRIPKITANKSKWKKFALIYSNFFKNLPKTKALKKKLSL